MTFYRSRLVGTPFEEADLGKKMINALGVAAAFLGFGERARKSRNVVSNKISLRNSLVVSLRISEEQKKRGRDHSPTPLQLSL